ncbi:hypothetical protein BO70DRAFT_359016 [Aspergillus heteromorphus CBS 117.55]|uniref:Zn(2)-C6 fungal-type domain-containing protein n=1 Tax=Aspergillus heteromorphus CBS 117.55 TaxID=1448321 RepID=A0A317WXQ4_9EURO|nr:uncharacterized protein BO70DRAFT_359016 [Aspergillus heteromorphus CBS 117.55]PWY90017.1 hypothetical protein BO70DRAFT_359016 [Aspergillus heteromorphus CBS 117.55]
MKPAQPVTRHACVRCIQLKVKCAPIQDMQTCERCARLGRSCLMPDSSRPSSHRSA